MEKRKLRCREELSAESHIQWPSKVGFILALCGSCIINKVLHCHTESDDWQLVVQDDFGRKENF